MTNNAQVRQVAGSCHCGAVRFEAQVDLASAFRCNCSACTKLAPTIGVVAPSAFRVVSGESYLARYEFGPKTLTRFFCQHCGVFCFARGRDPDGNDFVGVNINALDGVELVDLPLVYFDGRHDHYEPRSSPARILATR